MRFAAPGKVSQFLHCEFRPVSFAVLGGMLPQITPACGAAILMHVGAMLLPAFVK